MAGDVFVDSGIVSDRYLTYCNNIISTAATALPAKVITIKLCDLLPNTFFSINKNIYSSSILYLRFETNTINNIY
jgi:hypothetical protein